MLTLLMGLVLLHFKDSCGVSSIGCFESFFVLKRWILLQIELRSSGLLECRAFDIIVDRSQGFGPLNTVLLLLLLLLLHSKAS